ncbi:MAG: DNA-directed RNA polymerase subunit beta' [Chloroflexota bacterium]|nr:DNA-directed RNA polymerase subunit beta' [Chloroflexota bacterium]
MSKVSDFNTVTISLASPEQILSWSYGEVTKPETINYRTLKPAKDGLFCEKIFGPTKDYECYCGKYKKAQYEGVICDRCGVLISKSDVRRERMGHIELAAPVAHVWFLKGAPSRIGLLLGISPRSLERILYFTQYIITSVDEDAKLKVIRQMRPEYGIMQEQSSTEEIPETVEEIEIGEVVSNIEESSDDNPADEDDHDPILDSLDELDETDDTEEDVIELEELPLLDMTDVAGEDIDSTIRELESIRPLVLLTESRYQELKDKYGELFQAKMGAEAILDILRHLNLEETRENLWQEINSYSGQRRKKAMKRLEIVEAFIHSGNKPDWMILSVLPVLPPDVRPMVQLDGGRFATADLNDLYRRVINRNNRLKRLLELDAPEIIIHNEKRMLQEAVDSLIDNVKRGRVLGSAGSRSLKSLSDMLRGKQGRFRQNLLGKRVDYSGRSVIVVGPELKFHQCGLPKRMALELFKPFVMSKLVQQGIAANIKSAKRMVDRARTEVWDILDEVVKERPVLINRAPTLHRLGIQAFEPVLIDGSAIQIHPLVCAAFNADFDGDQMAVHVPLSRLAVKEARTTMLSSHNMLLPSNGDPVVTPSLDIVLGCYYLTSMKTFEGDRRLIFGGFEEAKLAHELGVIDLRDEIEVRTSDGSRIVTTTGRIIFNDILPEELRFTNETMDKSALKRMISHCIKLMGNEIAAEVIDNIKALGFKYATQSGVTISASDLEVPEAKTEILNEAEKQVVKIDDQYHRGLITEDERYGNIVGTWMEATTKVTDAVTASLDRYGGIYMMSVSGAKGNIAQISQMTGMRGLMTDPTGRIIDFPIKYSFREGLPVLEYFISTHGARKGLADTALRTSDSGYLTRRLVDVAQDMLIREVDCGTTYSICLAKATDNTSLIPLEERIIGRISAKSIVDPNTNEVIIEQNEEIVEEKAKAIVAAGITDVYVRSPLTCQSRHGLCQCCYGRDLARGKLANHGTAVGVMAAQSIGEPGTQLTLRTFHTGGVVGIDITSGLPRVEELFEARSPKGHGVISEIDGVLDLIDIDEGRRIRITSSEIYRDMYTLPENSHPLVINGEWVDVGAPLAQQPVAKDDEESPTTPALPVLARVAGRISIEGERIFISYEEKEEREYFVPTTTSLLVEPGTKVRAGQQLTQGHVNPQDILRISGKEAVQRYLVDEVQKVYRMQGVVINDKHIEVIVRQMLRKVCIDSPGDTELLPGKLIDAFDYEDINANILAEGGEPATAQPVLLGITKASLNSDSFLAAASFQETTRVLADAALHGKADHLSGLKENVIIGRLIPSRCLTDEEAPPEPVIPRLAPTILAKGEAITG